ncbi:hypothetical protein [Erythrobacter sp. EC-HK427]|uniref:hypothetical protein n=1 Tax=Erythrobacter sp. EC-HK427 TaxID=2038396 RepID=UPI0012565CF5|nr:hypothetical protein [Erythrobacter sp. EC-HK427]VVT12639.1 hypothetical protein ERY430_60326 [Erythrobacter sp. EC-HK427]
MDKSAIESGLVLAGFVKVHATKKLIEYRQKSEAVYVKVGGTDHPLVIHGRHGPSIAKLAGMQGVRRAKPLSKPYHNSNMRSFDLRQNTGKKATRYGFDFGFDSPSALQSFLMSL